MSIDFDDLTVEDVSRTFGRRRALSRITFRATRGAILGLLGPNGAGKTTFAREFLPTDSQMGQKANGVSITIIFEFD